MGSSPLLACVCRIGAPAGCSRRGTPSASFPTSGEPTPGFSSSLAHYLRDLHLQTEPWRPARLASALSPPPACQPKSAAPAPPPLPAGPQPRPAPAAPLLRSRGRAASSAVCKAGRTRLGGGAAPVSTNQRRDHIHANTSTMERAHHSLLQASLKRASV